MSAIQLKLPNVVVVVVVVAAAAKGVAAKLNSLQIPFSVDRGHSQTFLQQHSKDFGKGRGERGRLFFGGGGTFSLFTACGNGWVEGIPNSISYAAQRRGSST